MYPTNSAPIGPKAGSGSQAQYGMPCPPSVSRECLEGQIATLHEMLDRLQSCVHSAIRLADCIGGTEPERNPSQGLQSEPNGLTGKLEIVLVMFAEMLGQMEYHLGRAEKSLRG